MGRDPNFRDFLYQYVPPQPQLDLEARSRATGWSWTISRRDGRGPGPGADALGTDLRSRAGAEQKPQAAGDPDQPGRRPGRDGRPQATPRPVCPLPAQRDPRPQARLAHRRRPPMLPPGTQRPRPGGPIWRPTAGPGHDTAQALDALARRWPGKRPPWTRPRTGRSVGGCPPAGVENLGRSARGAQRRSTPGSCRSGAAADWTPAHRAEANEPLEQELSPPGKLRTRPHSSSCCGRQAGGRVRRQMGLPPRGDTRHQGADAVNAEPPAGDAAGCQDPPSASC